MQIDDTNVLTRFYGLQKQLECRHLNKVLVSDGIECWVDDEGIQPATFCANHLLMELVPL